MLCRIWKYVCYYEHCTYLVLFICIYLHAALAECLLMLYALLSMLNVISSYVVKHECLPVILGHCFLLYFDVTVLP